MLATAYVMEEDIGRGDAVVLLLTQEQPQRMFAGWFASRGDAAWELNRLGMIAPQSTVLIRDNALSPGEAHAVPAMMPNGPVPGFKYVPPQTQ